MPPSRVRTLVGYLAQKFSLYGDLSVDENIAFFGEIYGVPNAAERGRTLLGRMGMDRFPYFSRSSFDNSGNRALPIARSLSIGLAARSGFPGGMIPAPAHEADTAQA